MPGLFLCPNATSGRTAPPARGTTLRCHAAQPRSRTPSGPSSADAAPAQAAQAPSAAAPQNNKTVSPFVASYDMSFDVSMDFASIDMCPSKYAPETGTSDADDSSWRLHQGRFWQAAQGRNPRTESSPWQHVNNHNFHPDA